MRLETLARRLPAVLLEGDGAVDVRGISHDSRRIERGWIFAALPGTRTHGLEYLEEAVSRGAAAVLSDRSPGGLCPWLHSDRPRRDTALAAWALAGDPQDRLQLVGITGTNGKSTTADLLARVFGAAGRPAGLFGTLSYRVAGRSIPAERTTPEAPDLAPLLAALDAAGGRSAVMEVSSHAIAMDRVAGLKFQVAVLTNISRDHLDFHGDMESYFAVKRRLFDELLAPGGRRVLPADDPWGRRLLETPREGDVTWGIGAGTVAAVRPAMSLEGSDFTLRYGGEEAPVHFPLIGEHNLGNAMAAAAAALAAGLPLRAVREALETATPLPGRLQPVSTGLPFPVFVDYAHTPDGLRAVLESLRAVTTRRIVLVFGAGGDRDTGKRGPMGEAAGRLAHTVIVTSDNPRSEDPATIAAAVAAGVRAAGGSPLVELDRRRAITMGLEAADECSLLLVAGKGHENYQEIDGRRLPFSDTAVIAELAGGVTCA